MTEKRLKQSPKSKLNLCHISNSKKKKKLDFAQGSILAFNTHQVAKNRKTSSINLPPPLPSTTSLYLSFLRTVECDFDSVTDVAATNFQIGIRSFLFLLPPNFNRGKKSQHAGVRR